MWNISYKVFLWKSVIQEETERNGVGYRISFSVGRAKPARAQERLRIILAVLDEVNSLNSGPLRVLYPRTSPNFWVWFLPRAA